MKRPKVRSVEQLARRIRLQKACAAIREAELTLEEERAALLDRAREARATKGESHSGFDAARILGAWLDDDVDFEAIAEAFFPGAKAKHRKAGR